MSQNTQSSILKNTLIIIISLCFAAVFMWLALRGLEFKAIRESLSQANYWWILISVVFGLMAYWIRAIRWNLLLEPLGYSISSANSLWSLSFGYLMNLTIPRSGEIARSTALYSVEKVPVDKSFGTIVLERVVDLVCMLLFLGLSLVFKAGAIYSFYAQSSISINPALIIGIVLMGLIGSILFFILKERLKKLRFIGKIIGFIEGIFDGLLSIFRLKKKVLFIIESLGIWLCYYMATYMACFALPETADFSITDGFFIVVVGTLGMMIPASGGIGAYHFALKLGISALFLSMGRDADEGARIGLSYAFLSHSVQLVIMLVMGIISIPMLAKARKRA